MCTYHLLPFSAQLRCKCSQQLLHRTEMGKICRWVMTIFTGRSKDKRRQSSVVGESQCSWRFRVETEQKNHAMAVAAARAAAAEAAVVASQAADAVIRLMAAGNRKGVAGGKEAAAVVIQSVFRSYLARKALRALKGVVKMQAVVRGELVRRQVTATLRRIRILSSSHQNWTFTPVKQMAETYNGESNTNSIGNIRYPNRQQKERKEYRLSPHRASHRDWQKISPPPSAATTTINRRSSSWQCDDYAFTSLPIHNRPRTPLVLSQDHPQHPNYLADTASSRARARSQSAPRQRPEASEWQSRRMRRPSFDTMSLVSGARIQRFSSSMADTAQSSQQWSSVSPKNSECGSACSVLTNA